MTITITNYQVDHEAGTITFEETALKRKTGVGPPVLRAPYTLSGTTITLKLNELPPDLEVTL